MQIQLQLQLHYTTLHYTTLITLHLHYTTTATTTTLHYTTVHYNYNYTTIRYNTLQYTRLHYPIQLTPLLHLQLQLHYTNYTTWHLQLTTTTPVQLHLQLQLQLQLHYTTLHPAVVVRWPLQHCNHSKKHNSNHFSVHQWIRSAIRESQQPTLPIGFHSSATALCGTTGISIYGIPWYTHNQTSQ